LATLLNALVAHNNPWARLVLAEMLSQAGYSVAEASNGMSALRLARRDLPDLLVLDVALPEIAGDEVVEALQSDARTRGIEAVLVPSGGLTTLPLVSAS
jgi:CheY-like chemotaxis protein